MMALGPLSFAAPLALVSLVALPVLWWILRATPPAPRHVELPSLRLLEGVLHSEETPARTPWWIWLLRTLAALAAILGLAQPVYAPQAKSAVTAAGPVLIVVDNGWTSASRWTEISRAAAANLDSESRDTGVHLLLTAPQKLNVDPAGRMTPRDMQRRLSTLRPHAWTTDRNDALARLDASGLKPQRIFWASDGLESGGGSAFAKALAARAPLTIFAGPPRSAGAITGLASRTDSVTVTLKRAQVTRSDKGFISALTLDGSALATAEYAFRENANTTEATFKLPAAALSRVARFTITGASTAGTVWLWDSADRSRRVGLADTGTSAQPLLSDMHYIRKALEPFAEISEGNIEALVATSPDAIILTDAGQIAPADVERLTAWIEEGGALIRFAGPVLAAQGDDLLPVMLRRSSRALGGALAWEEPQRIAGFSEDSPFAGLTIPEDVRVRQQVLARPEPDLSSKTWARLEDGSPLVTAATRGGGTIILFHITAGPDWSDLAYSESFEQILRRAIAAGRGEAQAGQEGSYEPDRVLDAFGRLTTPGPAAAPLQASEFADAKLTEAHPPGLYKGPGGTRALNAGVSAMLDPITAWPASAKLLGDAETRATRFAGPLLALAAALLTLDLIVAIMLTGRGPRFNLRRAAPAVTALLIAFTLLPQARAQQQEDEFNFQPWMEEYRGAEIAPLASGPGKPKAEYDAALKLRFGYVRTGEAALDARTRAGLRGLTGMLNLRTSVEPAEPQALDLEKDALELYPLIYFNVPETPRALPEKAVARLNDYIRVGGAVIFDTRAGSAGTTGTDMQRLRTLIKGLDIPPLQQVPKKHVVSRSYYLLDDFPGRFAGRHLWIEETGQPGTARGDGVARIFVGDADWAGAWAVDDNGRDLYSVDGGPDQREMAFRFGVNLVMYVLTGSYKDDQVHLPALLERLGEDESAGPADRQDETQ